jgi:hypothetical protein
MLDIKLPSMIPTHSDILADLPGPGSAAPAPTPVAVVATGVAAACSVSQQEAPQTRLPAPPAQQTKNLDKLMEALAEVDRLFQDAYKIARRVREDDSDLEARLERAELEQRRCQQEAEHWRHQYASLENRIPWFVRRLFGAPT